MVIDVHTEPPKTAGEAAMRLADLTLQRMPLEDVGLEINAWLEAAWDAGVNAERRYRDGVPERGMLRGPVPVNPFDTDRQT